jgi:hypothetical protein
MKSRGISSPRAMAPSRMVFLGAIAYYIIVHSLMLSLALSLARLK